MRPLIKQYLGISAQSIPGLDTDEFGTFSGEIERPFDPITTLRKKIMKGLKQSGATLGIGSEGSFGPHPRLPFVQADQEVVMMIDLERDFEIFETVISTETNHARQEIFSLGDLEDFAERIQFTSHAMILKTERDGKVLQVQKGLINWEQLHAAYQQMASTGEQLVAESDMRAYVNPTRMKVIERATEQLMKKIVNTCPECQWPGFGCVETKPGLACRQCGDPTHLTLVRVYHCKSCGYQDERYVSSSIKADPAYCDQCNP